MNQQKKKSLQINQQNIQKNPKVAQNQSAETAPQDPFEGRTRRRRSAVTS